MRRALIRIVKPIGGGKRRTPVALQAVADGRLRLPGASVVPTGAACTALDVLEQLRVVVRLASAHSARLERATGVPGTQLWALHEVAAHDGLKVGELAQRLRLHQTTMSNLLRRLESRGLVRKGRSPHDGRIVHIHLTPAGRKTLKSSPGPARGLLPNVLDIMSAAELRKVHRGLAVLLEHMGGFDPTLAHRPLPFNE